MITHWKSFREVALPRMSSSKVGLDFVGAYKKHLAQMSELDFYEFQKLPLWDECKKFIELMVSQGTSQQEAMAFVRLVGEEAYAVSAFEHEGRRILKPTAQLTRELLNTDVTVPITEILPPFPSCWIEIVPGSDFVVVEEVGKEARDVIGIYVTWEKTSKETSANQAEFEQKGIWRDGGGMIRMCTDDAERAIGKKQELPAWETMFGDYFARFLIVSQGPYDQPPLHNFISIYSNMHWMANSTEEAEDMFVRLTPHWKKTTQKNIDYKCLVKAFHLVANLFVYMSSPQYKSDVSHTPNPLIKELNSELKKPRGRRNEKRLAKLQRMLLAETYEIGQNVEVVAQRIGPADEQSGTSEQGDRLSPSTHWRRAHWRRVWLKREGKDVQEWRRIQRTLVKGRGPVPTSTTYEIKHANPNPAIQPGAPG